MTSAHLMFLQLVNNGNELIHLKELGLLSIGVEKLRIEDGILGDSKTFSMTQDYGDEMDMRR